MIDSISNLNPLILTLLATGFTWAVTALGVSLVFFVKQPSRKLLDSMLGFAAGAMIYVVIEEIIPESQKAENTDLATFSALIGFVLMMVLDVAFS